MADTRVLAFCTIQPQTSRVADQGHHLVCGSKLRRLPKSSRSATGRLRPKETANDAQPPAFDPILARCSPTWQWRRCCWQPAAAPRPRPSPSATRRRRRLDAGQPDGPGVGRLRVAPVLRAVHRAISPGQARLQLLLRGRRSLRQAAERLQRRPGASVQPLVGPVRRAGAGAAHRHRQAEQFRRPRSRHGGAGPVQRPAVLHPLGLGLRVDHRAHRQGRVDSAVLGRPGQPRIRRPSGHLGLGRGQPHHCRAGAGLRPLEHHG